jgi:hypothetical protein
MTVAGGILPRLVVAPAVAEASPSSEDESSVDMASISRRVGVRIRLAGKVLTLTVSLVNVLRLRGDSAVSTKIYIKKALFSNTCR